MNTPDDRTSDYVCFDCGKPYQRPGYGGGATLSLVTSPSVVSVKKRRVSPISVTSTG